MFIEFFTTLAQGVGVVACYALAIRGLYIIRTYL